MTAVYAAVSRRPSQDPIRHGLPGDVTWKKGQATVRALCGAQVGKAVAYWDSDHPRACPGCREATA